jgi:hypothetical protein
MVPCDKQAHAGTGAWGTRGSAQAPWCGERDALAWIAAQHRARNGNLFGERRNALVHLAVGHPQRIVLGSIAARADAKGESSRGDRIERCRDLCRECGMPLRDIEHQRADMQIRTERQCSGGQRGRL